jgi:hypothetical protein
MYGYNEAMVNTLEKLGLIFILLTVFKGFSTTTDRYLIRINNPTENLFKRLYHDECRDIAAYIPGKYIDLVVEESEYQGLKNQHLSLEIIETGRQIENRLKGSNRSTQGYRTYEDMLSELQKLEKDYPDICKLYDIGDSQGKIYAEEGLAAYEKYSHDIWAMKISDNVEKEEDEPCVLYMGEHHAREAASMEVCMAILNNFIKNYGSDQTVTDRVDNCQIWCVPLVNPNGHKVALDKINTMWRKNIRDNDKDKKISDGFGGFTSDGVDLNRNYGFNWGKPGASKNPRDATYHGPSGFSEPETQAIKKLMDTYNFFGSISYHLYGELVLWPYGYSKSSKAPDLSAIEDFGKKIALKLKKLNGGTYTPQQGSDLYPASGVTDDWAYGIHGTFCYTVELYNNTFWPPISALSGLCEDNLDAAMEMANRITYSALTGHIINAETQKPIEAIVYVKEIDDTVANGTNYRAPYKSNKKFGSYYRLLMPKSYTVTFRAHGFPDTAFNNVVISKDTVTVLDVNFGKATGITNNISNTSLSNKITIKKYRNSLVKFLLEPGNTYYSIGIYSIQGKRIKTFPANCLQSNIVNWDISGLENGLYLIRFQSKYNHKTMSLMLTK